MDRSRTAVTAKFEFKQKCNMDIRGIGSVDLLLKRNENTDLCMVSVLRIWLNELDIDEFRRVFDLFHAQNSLMTTWHCFNRTIAASSSLRDKFGADTWLIISVNLDHVSVCLYYFETEPGFCRAFL